MRGSCTRCRNSRRPLYPYHTGTPKRSLYRRDVYYRGVIKWPAIPGTISLRISSLSSSSPTLQHPHDSHSRLSRARRYAEGREVMA